MFKTTSVLGVGVQASWFRFSAGGLARQHFQGLRALRLGPDFQSQRRWQSQGDRPMCLAGSGSWRLQ